MMYIPPDTIKRKVEALRHHLPGVNLYTVMKGMPTVLSRSSSTVPRGLDALREVGGAKQRGWGFLFYLFGGWSLLSFLNEPAAEKSKLHQLCQLDDYARGGRVLFVEVSLLYPSKGTPFIPSQIHQT